MGRVSEAISTEPDFPPYPPLCMIKLVHFSVHRSTMPLTPASTISKCIKHLKGAELHHQTDHLIKKTLKVHLI